MNEAYIPEVPDVDIVEPGMGRRWRRWSIRRPKRQSNILKIQRTRRD